MAHTPDIETQQDYYTNRWNNFVFANKLDMSRMAAVLRIVADVEFPKPPAICDLGCGPGWSTSVLGMFGKAVGVDLSDVSLAAARYPHCTFESANILEWDGPREAFDVVVSIEVIEHIPRALQPQFVDIAHRLLKPGGHLILTTPNARTMRAMPKGGKEWSNQPVEEWLEAGELRALLDARFQVRDIDSIIFGPGATRAFRIANSAKLKTLAERVGAGSAWSRFRSRGGFGLHLVAHAQKPLGA